MEMLMQVGAAFVATVSFVVLVPLPTAQYLYPGICGSVGRWCYLLVRDRNLSATVAAFAWGVMRTLMAR